MQEFLERFYEAHLPLESHFIPLCDSCHKSYDIGAVRYRRSYLEQQPVRTLRDATEKPILNAMLGAIAKRHNRLFFERSRVKFYDFDLFYPWSRFTDDSVMTLAVASVAHA